MVASMRVWSGDPSFSVQHLRMVHAHNGLELKIDGFCKAGSRKDESTEHMTKRPTVGYCIEPMKANYDLLVSSFRTTGYNKDIRLIQAAVSSTTGMAKFPITRIGDETAGLDTPGQRDRSKTVQFDDVKIITLDDYFDNSALPNDHVIDWLSIDTEGNDARVIIGATNLFLNEKIRAFEFEYHKVGHWQNSSLEDLIDQIDHFGFDCYWEFNSGMLTRITGCWDHSYNERGHSNIACAHRKSLLAPIMSKLHHEMHHSLH
jgi:FkbM family methyltransferase